MRGENLGREMKEGSEGINSRSRERLSWRKKPEHICFSKEGVSGEGKP